MAPSGLQRRLLVELLASELDSNGSVRVDDAARALAFEELLGSGMVYRAGASIALTSIGRELASQVADQMLGPPFAAQHRA